MDTLLKSFNLPLTEFTTLLQDSNGIVAGGAALYAYLHPKHTSAPMFTGDIDIWIQVDDGRDSVVYGQKPLSKLIQVTRNMVVRAWTYFLVSHGYKPVESTTNGQYGSARFANSIRKIHSFVNPEGKKVQIILIFVPVDKICETFDYSVCATWWTGRGEIKTLDPENTLKRFVYPITTLPITKKEEERLEKYRKRGFTAFDTKPAPDTLSTFSETW